MRLGKMRKLKVLILTSLFFVIFSGCDTSKLENPIKAKPLQPSNKLPAMPEPAPAPGTEQAQPTLDDLKKKAKIENLDELIRDLKDKNPDTQKKAAQALTIIGTPAVEPLIPMLKNKDPKMRQWAANTLGMIKDNRAVLPLIEILSDNDMEVHMGVTYALGELRDTRAIGPLIEVLKYGSNAKWDEMYALWKIGKPAVEPLIAALNDKNTTHRFWIARTLAGIKDDRISEPLILAFKNKDLEVIAGGSSFFVNRYNFRKEGILMEALNTYGDSATANTFMNSSDKELERIGRQWAENRGYTILQLPRRN